MTARDRLDDKLGAEGVEWLADRLDEVNTPGRVAIECDAGPGGRLMQIAVHITKRLDLSRIRGARSK